MSDRNTIIKRINAFLARSKDSASTYDEAMKAAEVAAKLIDQHGITDTELSGKVAADFVAERIHVPVVWHQTFYRSAAITAIGQYTGTFAYINNNAPKRGAKRDIRVVFYGRPANVKFAIWLTETVGQFLTRGCANEEPKGLGRTALGDFRFGYLAAAATQVRMRLLEMLTQRNADRSAAGNTLPALLDEATQAKADLESKMRLNPPKNKTRPTTQEALDKGRARGDAAPLNRGVEHAHQKALT